MSLLAQHIDYGFSHCLICIIHYNIIPVVATPEFSMNEILRLRLRMTEEGVIQIFVFA